MTPPTADALLDPRHSSHSSKPWEISILVSLTSRACPLPCPGSWTGNAIRCGSGGLTTETVSGACRASGRVASGYRNGRGSEMNGGSDNGESRNESGNNFCYDRRRGGCTSKRERESVSTIRQGISYVRTITYRSASRKQGCTDMC